VVIGGLQPEVSHEPDGHPPAPSFPELVSPEDEARVAAQLLLQAHQAPELLDRCSPHEFVTTPARAVVAAVEALLALGETPHIKTIEIWLATRSDHPSLASDEIGALADVVWRDYQRDSALAPGPSVLQSAGAVRDLARQRQLAQLCATVRGTAGRGTTAADLLRLLRVGIEDIAAHG